MQGLYDWILNDSGIRIDVIIEYFPLFMKGTLYTLGISISGILIGCILGLIIAFGKMSRLMPIRLPFVWYINFFRGTPLLVQILIIHFGVTPLFIAGASPIKAVISAIIALSLNSAAYLAEIYRAGIQSIDKGQVEAGRSLGMNKVQTMSYIVLPQSIKRMIPPFGNEFITLIKDSSLASVIAAPELLYWARAVNGKFFIVWESLLFIALIYLVITLSLTYLLNYIEKRWNIDDNR
ncbi:amino acid ABC transporter permease [Chengkuizengella marina]|uniref:Amino acid ABC transporter permease n=1 Tax=Chengkuizengella marina TaxID=2507566 RepID=A0A6N9Q4T9_9BACL|nr:amino acid ABC transporter permease [Chengkuizengella marina]NBI29634.1 amino acid ABC transporter permease [Chengkuizengella marina]